MKDYATAVSITELERSCPLIQSISFLWTKIRLDNVLIQLISVDGRGIQSLFFSFFLLITCGRACILFFLCVP